MHAPFLALLRRHSGGAGGARSTLAAQAGAGRPDTGSHPLRPAGRCEGRWQRAAGRVPHVVSRSGGCCCCRAAAGDSFCCVWWPRNPPMKTVSWAAPALALCATFFLLPHRLPCPSRAGACRIRTAAMPRFLTQQREPASPLLKGAAIVSAVFALASGPAGGLLRCGHAGAWLAPAARPPRPPPPPLRRLPPPACRRSRRRASPAPLHCCS